MPVPPAAGSPLASLRPTALPHLASHRPSRTPAPARPGGTNCPGKTAPARGLTFSFAPPWAKPRALSAVSRGPVPIAARELPPSALPPLRLGATRAPSYPAAGSIRYELGRGLRSLSPAGGDPLHRSRGSAASRDRATVRLQRSGERCARRISVAHPRRPLLYHGPAPRTLAGGPCLPDHQAVRSAPLGQNPAWPGLAASRAELSRHKPSGYGIRDSFPKKPGTFSSGPCRTWR